MFQYCVLVISPDGKVPVSIFSLISIDVTLKSFPNSDGMDPDKKLMESLIDINPSIFPISEG